VGVRALLVLVALGPTLAMVAVVALSVRSAWADRTAADRLEGEVANLVAIVDSRRALANETLNSSVLTVAAELGLRPDRIEELYGVDYVAELAASRTVVDDDLLINRSPALASTYADVLALRPQIDDGTASFDTVDRTLGRLRAGIDDLRTTQIDDLEESRAFRDLSSAARGDFEVLGNTFSMLAASDQRAGLTNKVLTEPASSQQVAALFDANARFETAVDAFVDDLGPRGTRAWQRFSDDPTSESFEATIAQATEVGASGAAPPFEGDPAAFGDAFAGGPTWATHLTGVVRAAAADLAAQSRADAAGAMRSVLTRCAIALALTIVSLGTATLLASTIQGPARRLGLAARQIRDGRFDLPALDLRGPRELADAAEAFNEMTVTLAAVESNAVMLVEDPGGVDESDALPGRTGQALHAALDRLRASIVASEEQRVQLQQMATHDSLTGLLNRGAAIDALGRDLARARREHRSAMVLFIDVDGLKTINDTYGHAAGDAALVLVADALRATTRGSDTAARQGGDEFLVAGVVDNDLEVQALGERICSAVAAADLNLDGHRVALHCSIGMAATSTDDSSDDALIREADAALYEAKALGRDQVAWAPVATAR